MKLYIAPPPPPPLFLSKDDTFVFDPSACSSGFNTSCDDEGECVYAANWRVSGDFVDFTVSARVDLGRWVAIGFSDDIFMVRQYASKSFVTRCTRGHLQIGGVLL